MSRVALTTNDRRASPGQIAFPLLLTLVLSLSTCPVCRLPGTLSPIYLPTPGAVLCLSLSLLFSFIFSSCLPVASPSPPQLPHPILLFHTFPAGPQLRPHHIHERLHCLLLVCRLFDLHRLASPYFFFSPAYFSN